MAQLMTLGTLLQIGIVGTFLSLLVQVIKINYGPNSNQTKLLVVLMALLFGTLYVLIKDTRFFETFILILMSSTTIYAFFIKE